MEISAIPQQPVTRRQEENEEEDPIIRFLYALGVVLTAFGAILPGGAKWSTVGIALVAFTYIY